MPNLAPSTKEIEQAQRQVGRFVRRFEPSYLQLAYYAALPLILTPELLHYLRNQFLRNIHLPWVAEADLLLSDLCYPVGYEQYALETAVRAYLMQEMEEHLGADHLQSAAKLLLQYVQHVESVNPYRSRQDLQDQQLAAMVYIDDEQREKVVRHLADVYQKLSELGERASLSASAQAEMARLSRFTEELAPKLNAYPQLLNYARVVGQLLEEPQNASRLEIEPSYQVMQGVELEVPQELLPEIKSPPGDDAEGFPPLTQFEFLDARFTDSDLSDFPPPLETGEFVILTLQPEEHKSDSIGLEVFDFTIATLKGSRDEWSIQRQQHSAQRYVEHLSDNIELEMVAIPGGTFVMGSPKDEPGRYDSEGPQHPVTVEPFFMGRYPVTQRQWKIVANLYQIEHELETDQAHIKGDNKPIDNVSWNDAMEFCARLSHHTDRVYRLPTEAEWEYACRAGTTTAFHFGDTITTDVANYNGSAYGDGPEGAYREETTLVGHFGFANVFGLSDMHGNVFEWCQDYWHDSYKGAPTDGSAWEDHNEDGLRILRGGSWDLDPRYCRSAFRTYHFPDDRIHDIGFRVVCSAPSTLP